MPPLAKRSNIYGFLVMAGAGLPRVLNDMDNMRFLAAKHHILDAQGDSDASGGVHALRHMKSPLSDSMCSEPLARPIENSFLRVHFYPLRATVHFHRYRDRSSSNRKLEEALSKRPTEVLDGRSRCVEAGRPRYGNPLRYLSNSQVQAHGPLLPDLRMPSLLIAATCSGRSGHRDQTTHSQGCIITSSRIAFNSRDSRNNPQAPQFLTTAPRSSNNPPSFAIS
ncbi:hypothetical protein EDB84DRAFT_1524080 [Lactarius hengduanensis]|nr:hypothetical protein EDB84DRAFT_1524080 [Lactarius hengduanensis]